jgi:metal-responsive CopG/Arc/MetJ family transcriptional regulator
VVIPFMDVVSVKVDKKVKDKMKKLSNVNWSEIIRQALAKKIQEEESKVRIFDTESLQEAAAITDRMRKASKRWNSTEEIRRWRQTKM